MRELQQQIETLQRQRLGTSREITPVRNGRHDMVELSFETDDSVVRDILDYARPVLTPGAAVRLRMSDPGSLEGVRPNLFQQASAIADWLRENGFADVRIDALHDNTASSGLSVSARRTT
jgi:hypothetical protein